MGRHEALSCCPGKYCALERRAGRQVSDVAGCGRRVQRDRRRSGHGQKATEKIAIMRSATCCSCEAKKLTLGNQRASKDMYIYIYIHITILCFIKSINCSSLIYSHLTYSGNCHLILFILLFFAPFELSFLFNKY